MATCAVLGCLNKSLFLKGAKRFSENPISFHRFPVDHRRKLWIEATGRVNWQPTAHSFICSRHFDVDCFKRKNPVCKMRITRNALPTLYTQMSDSKHVEQDAVLSEDSSDNESCNDDENSCIGHGKFWLLLKQKQEKLAKIQTQCGENLKRINKLTEVVQDLKQERKSLKTELQFERILMGVPRAIYKQQLRRADYTALRNDTYEEEIKIFSIKLFLCSSEAYDFVRSSFNNVLPPTSDVQRWITEKTNKSRKL